MTTTQINHARTRATKARGPARVAAALRAHLSASLSDPHTKE
jgi:hypothetical protein